MDLAVSVLVVQQALAQVARGGQLDTDPGRLDGRWGPNTREALATYIERTALLTLPERQQLVQRIISPGTPYAQPQAHTIFLPSVLVNEFGRLSSAFMRQVPPGVDVPANMQNGGRPVSVQPVNNGPTVLDPVYASQSSGMSSGTAIALGIGAAALLVGGGYWLLRGKRGRR